MTGSEVYTRAVVSLGYKTSPILQEKSIVIINQVYDDLSFCIEGEYTPINTLSDKINLPETVASNAMVYGVAEKLALGEGDGELQQYFARAYDRAKARITVIDQIVDVFGGKV